jgi:hypothetical protein
MEDLETLLLNFERIIAEPLPSHVSGSPSPIAPAIREIYATRTAFALLSAVRLVFPETGELGRAAVPPPGLRPSLPSLEDIKAAAPCLVEAVTLRNLSAAIRALERMGVLALCPSCDQDFSRLEYSVGSIVGRVRLIPLVELANLAAELHYFENASRYVAEAHSLSPGPAQLHQLHTVAGLIALNLGNLESATKYLAASVRVCRKNDWACLDCGVREQNLTLADRLLDQGQHAVVISFLVECLSVWKHSANRMRQWIDEIRAGKRPDLSAPSILFRGPEGRMKMQILLGDLFIETPAEHHDFGTLEEFRKRNAEEVRRAIRGQLDKGSN